MNTTNVCTFSAGPSSPAAPSVLSPEEQDCPTTRRGTSSTPSAGSYTARASGWQDTKTATGAAAV